MTYTLLIFSLILSNLTPIRRISENHIRDYYVCSQEEKNCEFIINFFINRSTVNIQISNYKLKDLFIMKSLYKASDKGINIRALINVNQLDDTDFYLGNSINLYLDEHLTLKSYIIIDDKTTIIIKQEAIEIINNRTASTIYENEFIKHMNHSIPLEENKN